MVGLGGWLGALIIGGLAGWVASKVAHTDKSQGVFLNIVVGIVGAVIGNLLLPVLGIPDSNGFTIWSFVVAFVGALILLTVLKAISGSKK